MPITNLLCIKSSLNSAKSHVAARSGYIQSYCLILHLFAVIKHKAFTDYITDSCFCSVSRVVFYSSAHLWAYVGDIGVGSISFPLLTVVLTR